MPSLSSILSAPSSPPRRAQRSHSPPTSSLGPPMLEHHPPYHPAQPPMPHSRPPSIVNSAHASLSHASLSMSDLPPPPPPTSGPGTPMPPDMTRPLNVTDALSYLDAVKIQFQDRPDVYNQFLDIMKDFKGQVIDTPGVIERVSMLFHGNPYLIQGFNTFLPPGYHINCTTDRQDVNHITVTTPNGMITSSTNSMSKAALLTVPPLAPTPIVAYPAMLPPMSAPASRTGTPHAMSGRPPLPQQHMQQGYYDGPQPPQPYSPNMQGASMPGNVSTKSQVEITRAPPTSEFDHAIQFLNRIKTRYPDGPNANTYKQFLEILQIYRKEQTNLFKDPTTYQQREKQMMTDVYAQVQLLFKDAPDLLGEFKKFLPELMGATGMDANHLAGIMPAIASGSNSGWPAEPIASSSTAPKGTVPPSRRRKREPAQKDTPQSKAEPGRQDSRKKPRVSKQPAKGRPPSPEFAAYRNAPTPPPLPPLGPGSVVHPNLAPYPPSYPGPPQLSTPGLSHAQMANTMSVPSQQGEDPFSKEVAFFGHLKQALPAAEHEDFVKLLGLYNADIIDMKTLMTQADTFIGHLAGDLLGQFKQICKWDERRSGVGRVDLGPPGSVRTGPPEPIPFMADKGQGPSYRRLPESEARLATSGRSQLGRSVLNDEWVSHPTWASEEAGFVAHKKNIFEDLIHKTEDERHEYQIHLEGMARTIAILEPLNARIEELSAEERATFKLPPDLGGQSKAIYQRTLKKVYNKDQGAVMYQALLDNPIAAVPVVLARLKQKNEDWKRAQREWGIFWRQMEVKNFYKSLDHIGINFKANDKKNITAKSFVTEIETLRKEALESGESFKERKTMPACAIWPPGPQLTYGFEDTEVLHDSLKMVYSYLDHNPQVYSLQERRSVERFLRSFVPTLFMVPIPEFSAACGSTDVGMDDDDSSDEQTMNDTEGFSEDAQRGGKQAGSAPQVNGSGAGGVNPGHLRKKLLKTAGRSQGGQRDTPSAVGSRSGSPIAVDAAALPAAATTSTSHDAADSIQQQRPAPPRAKDVWIRESLPDGDSVVWDSHVDRRPFFANTTLYTLLRLLQLVYSRLEMCKKIGAGFAKSDYRYLLANPVALRLGLEDPQGPSVILEQMLTTLGGRDLGDSNFVYIYLLEACEKLFDNEMDLTTFEEQMRWFFGTRAYHLYTLDKVIAALIKQVQTVVSDNKCQELWDLLRKTRQEKELTRQDVMRYRREAAKHVGSDDNLYRVEWDATAKEVRIQLVGPDEGSVEETRSGVTRWRQYVESYVLEHATEWVGRGSEGRKGRGSRPVFMKRLLKTEGEGGAEDAGVVVEDGLAVRVSLGSYKVFFEGFECLYRR